MHKALDYRGRCVVITGAAGASAGAWRRASPLPAPPELLDRDADALARLADELAGETPHCTALDLSDRQAVQQYADDLACRGLNADVLINNAGVEYATPLGECSFEADQRWSALLENNVGSMQRLTRALLPRLRAGASVINQASIWGLKGVPGFSAYVASKHAVVGLTRSLAGSWARGASG